MRLFIVSAIFSAGLTYLFFTYFIISIDVSIDKTLWFIDEPKNSYDKGDYILFNINDEHIKQFQKIIKQVVCVGGDMVKINENRVYCNDTYLGEILELDRKGQPLYPFTKNAEVMIPEDYYFVTGVDVRSYDSRYFGLIDEKRIITEVRPIL